MGGCKAPRRRVAPGGTAIQVLLPELMVLCLRRVGAHRQGDIAIRRDAPITKYFYNVRSGAYASAGRYHNHAEVDNEIVNLRMCMGEEIEWHSDGDEFAVEFPISPFERNGLLRREIREKWLKIGHRDLRFRIGKQRPEGFLGRLLLRNLNPWAEGPAILGGPRFLAKTASLTQRNRGPTSASMAKNGNAKGSMTSFGAAY